jgi:transcriptional regulator GlxA family with amidase domain
MPSECRSLPKLRVGFLLTPRFTLTAFAGFIDALRLAADDSDGSRQIDCEWAVLGSEFGLIASSCGAMIQPSSPLEDADKFDYIVIVGGLLHGGQKVFPGTNGFLKKAARARVPLVGLCTGSFVLARAGLLDGYEVCVHWLHREEFLGEFPGIQVETNRMFVVDRDRLTCAGGTSVVHLATHLIEKHCSRAQAVKSLRILIEDTPLPSNAWQPEAVITRQARDGLVRKAMLMIEQDLTKFEPLSVVLRSLSVSIRQIERRFISDVGMTPSEYRSRLRLTRAKWMLEHTTRSITEISIECGFGGSSHFSNAYKQHFGTQPSRDRRQRAEACGPVRNRR